MTLSSLRAGLSSLVLLGGAVGGLAALGCSLIGCSLIGCSGAGGGAERFADDTPGSDPSVTPLYGGGTTSGPTPANSTPGSTTTPGGTSGGTATGSTPSEGNPTPGQVVTGSAPGSNDGSSELGAATMGGSGSSTDRYKKADVTRDGQNYFFMANGWGPGFVSQNVTWNGTSFTVTMQGMQGPNYQPASYPTVFCGAYSDSRSKECGLPATLDSMTALRTGWSWDPNGNDGQYNAAYDIWLGTTTDRSSFSGYLMVWYREPVGQQPAGQKMLTGVSVQNVSGTWDVWTGQVGGKPIINFVRAEGQDTHDMEFDILDFVRDVRARNLTVPGTTVLSVAVGFEMWQPVNELKSKDFYVEVD
jgi:hypothetical protein